MTEKDWKPFTILIERAYRLYQRPPLEIDVMRMYFDTLSYLPIEAVAEGVQRHMRGVSGTQGKFAPTPADITLALFGTPEQQAAKAWIEVQKVRDGVGTSKSVRFDDPKIHAALLACGGWVGLTWAKQDKWPCFRQAYLAAITNEISWDDVPDHMQGEDELDGGWGWNPTQIVDVKTQKYTQLSQKDVPLQLSAKESEPRRAINE